MLQYSKGMDGLKKCFDTEHNAGFFDFHHGVAMASKYPVIAAYRTIDRMQMNVVQFMKNITIGIIVVHFNYRDEKVRIAEHSKMSDLIARNQEIPLIFIGDFNWENIMKIRSENQWDEPKTELMSLIKDKGAFMDSLYVLRDSKEAQNAVLENEANLSVVSVGG